mmetsp:Transcript_12905/g.33621  ORF Transcript_12905/g.33621 Transcript_12905/m.33621 type:complete len:227 (+) Transcript_12905:1-681(+)
MSSRTSLGANNAVLVSVVAAGMLVATALCKSVVRATAPRRPLSLMSAHSAASARLPDGCLFGRFEIPQSQLFFASPSQLTLALVNLRPIVPGHVLVIPKRVVPRMHDLTVDELTDLWRSVSVIAHRLEAHYGATAANIAVQDGRDAGQTVPHVHVHILPRKPADFKRNDDVYDALERHDASQASATHHGTKLHVPADEDRKDRTADEMAQEACELHALFLDRTTAV